MNAENKAVFLSYASQDAEAARRICESLRQAGVEVWFDQSDLRGGDTWDAMIRKRIKECALFVPVISANTQARAEGYFRLEWHLAEQRSHLIARGRPFIVPVAIDDTRDAEALVPEAFLAVQWTHMPIRQAQGRPDDGQSVKAFAERIAVLMHGPRTGASRPPVRDSETHHPPAEAAPRKHPRRLLWSAGSILGLAAATAYFLLRPSPDVGPVAPVSPPGATELSETDKLVARASAILDGSALTPEQIGTANELLAQAMERDPSNAAAWSAAARADRMMIYPYGYDRSEERRQRAMNRATRALNLAPDSFDARVVHTAVMAHASGNPDLTREAEATFRRLVRERPDDIPLQVSLAEVLREQRRFDEAAALFESIGDFELAAWSWQQDGQSAAAYALVKRAVIAKRTTTALHLKARIESDWFQDLAAAQATMAGFRPSELREELGAATAISLAFFRREPERMLQITSAVSHDFMDSHAFVGPRQYWTGWAHHLAGRAERAAIEWRKAITVLQFERAKAPDRVVLFDREAEIQALLGEHAEAARLLASAQRIANEAPDVVNDRNHRAHLALGHREQVLAWLTSFLREKADLRKPDRGWYWIHAAARFSPIWDGLRDDPRFETLLRETKPEGAKAFDEANPGQDK